MCTPHRLTVPVVLLLSAGALLGACRQPSAAGAADVGAPSVVAASDIEAGRYLITIGSCDDCHTPGWMERGPGVPEAERLTGLPIGFRGPWGTSYPRNLRLTVQELSEDAWVARLQGAGLPPMPWANVNAISEEDARAMYRYIRSLGPAGVPAPEPVPPGEEPTTPYFDFVPQHMERLGSASSAP